MSDSNDISRWHGHDHGVDCFDPKITEIIQCVCELKRVCKNVLECMEDCHNPHQTALRVYFCLVLNEIKSVEGLLTNDVFGLNEIKNEVRGIENDTTLINTVVNLINDSVNSSEFGLNEIKNEVRGIENDTTIINTVVNLINESVNSPEFGLNEIKNEIRGIENDTTIINTVVNLINESVNSTEFGLNEIKNEVRGLENRTGDFSPNVTTGPVYTAPRSDRLVVKVLNNNNSDQAVRVRVFSLDECPKNEVYNRALLIEACCANETIPYIVMDDPQILEYEVQVLNLIPGMYVWSATFPDNQINNHIAQTLFRNRDFSPLIGNCV